MIRLRQCTLVQLVLAVVANLSLALPAFAQTAAFPPRNQATAVFVGHSLINYEMPRMVKALAASKSGMSMTNAVQVIIGSPLRWNWDHCREAGFNDQYPPEDFACDELERGTGSGPYDVLIATDANNTIESNRIYNQTHVYFERFMDLLLARNGTARSFVFTSWESWGFHGSGSWLDAINSELAQYEQIARDAEAASAARGRNGKVQVIPANVGLRELINAGTRGQIPNIRSHTDVFSDGVHLTPAGNYFVACVVFASVFNQSPEGATGRVTGEWGQTLVDLPAGQAAAMQRLAWKVVSDYRGGVAASPRPRAPTAVEVR
jgi:hypothetical protein